MWSRQYFIENGTFLLQTYVSVTRACSSRWTWLELWCDINQTQSFTSHSWDVNTPQQRHGSAVISYYELSLILWATDNLKCERQMPCAVVAAAWCVPPSLYWVDALHLRCFALCDTMSNIMLTGNTSDLNTKPNFIIFFNTNWNYCFSNSYHSGCRAPPVY